MTEFVESFSGLTYTPNDVQENGTLVLRSSNVSNGEVVDADNVYVNPQVVNSENVKVGDIVVVVRNGSRSLIGKHAQIKAFMPNTVIGAFMTGIRSECPEFTNALLNTSRFEEEIAMNMGATINQITGYMFSKMEFKVPCLDEQKKIGEYFEKLDRLITLHQRQPFLHSPPDISLIVQLTPPFYTFSWEQRKWINTVDISTNMVDPKSGKYDLLPHVAPGNIESFTGRLYDNVKLVGEENLISGKFVFNVGDIVYGKINPQLGKYVFARFSGLTSADAYVLNAKNGIVQKFLYAVIQTRDFYDYSVSVSKRSGMPKINRDELNAYSYWAPSESEQLKIGEYLLTLDHLITLHQRKFEKLTNVKKSMLEKMFPQNGSSYPEIRFKGFTDPWEQRKAIDIADYSKGNGYSKGDLTDAGTPIILYGRLYTKYQFAISEVDTFAVPRNGAVYSQGNEVIVPASGETAEDIARASAVEKSGVLLGGDLNILRPFDFINPLFLALAISNGEPQKELAKKAQGKSVVHIHNTDIQEVTIVYPSRTEQDRIVSVFRQLDHLITLHQRELKKLQNIKKSMLEKMFV